MQATLYELTGDYLKLIEMAEDNDSEAIKDTLESVNEAIDDKAENTAKVIRELEGRSETKKKEAQRLRESATSLDNQIRNLKSYLQEQLELTNRTKIQGELFTVSVQNNPPSVYVENEKKVPLDYFVEQDPKLDKTLLKNALKNGNEIDGAELRQQRSLRIR
ncbi:siphovirus Gp157 family protein [Tetragenococcus koreensis]|uniref:siphovirus Gp157 family protein n=1 Tax=Tetragenococcus koreensis TaxID=290335 RepID=UPI001F333CE4|nr:siphovirus Gp157 family protein [Tetragenococcus koreensis]MCF1614659.1 siphovirus Gp157 family protein [Tetragenococcus koreensis]MCF1624422.1 siphovirus Gp157 family protein [Tetragenococcus koreensis]